MGAPDGTGSAREPCAAPARVLALLACAGLGLGLAEEPIPVPASLPGAEAFSPELRAELAGALRALGPDYEPRTAQRRADGSPRYTNRLLLEASPYLRQHAHNPVDWHPWGDEAFARARRLSRPVLVSIGYSTCHWCHVMEEESFDDPEVAALLNGHFVAIKVDREARPDVDAIYMAAVRAMGQRGGWPLNVWVTPDRKPFFGGTYFPPDDRAGRPGFARVLTAIHEQWSSDPAGLQQLGERVTAAIADSLAGAPADSTRIPNEAALRSAADLYARRFDDEWGGLRGRSKFPASLPVRLLLRHHRRSGDARSLEMVTLTLEKMSAGGIRDHVGGGFHRYATDPRWLVPHFEKMLYDNALVSLAYLEAWQVTGRDDFARLVRETLDYLEREMRAPEGGFYSATDADSPAPDGEPEEGRFFTWRPAEVERALGTAAAAVVNAWYGVTPEGNLGGRAVLHTWSTPGAVAKRVGVAESAVGEIVAASRPRLYEVRAERAPPLRDDKVLAAWNGLAISAFARAGFALAEPRYLTAAARAADFVLTSMRVDGHLHRVYLDGRAAGPAFCEDHAFLIAGLLDLYEATSEARWLREALALQASLDRDYADEAGGGYYRSAAGGVSLIAREKPGADDAMPSGNAVAALNLLRLSALTGDDTHRERALRIFAAFHDDLVERPTEYAEMLLALDFELDTSREVIVVRPPGADAEAFLDVLRRSYLPNQVAVVVTQKEQGGDAAELVPLIRNKVARGGRVTAYVCENRVCQLPTNDPTVFRKQLSAVVALP
jgi:uncharacterized protein YyaL (SSP411 family)